MNKRILISLSVIAAVAAIAIGGTVAYFSDVEKSEGNTFTAGTLDLWLDMVKPDGTIEKYNGKNMQLFNLADIKPGDSGEKTVSLHVDNDAWLCVYGSYTDADNGCNEPEDVVDNTCDNPGTGQGELDENMNILVWWDDGAKDDWQCGETPKCTDDPTEGDNIYQDTEVKLYEGKLSSFSFPTERYPIATSTVYYMGIKWSVPTDVGNIIQSDSVVANAGFYAEQQKNNSGFTCPTTLP